MLPKFREHLQELYLQAMQDTEVTHMVLGVRTPDSEGIEFIINPRENFAKKSAYLMNTYGDDWAMVKNPDIFIVSIHFCKGLDEVSELMYSLS